MLNFTTDPELEIGYITFVNSSSNTPDPELGMCYIMSIIHIVNYLSTRLSFNTDPEFEMCYITYVNSPNCLGLGSSRPDPELGMCYIMSMLNFTTDP